MTYELGGARRWRLSHNGNHRRLGDNKMSMVARLEDYDLLYDSINFCYTVVKAPSKKGYNFTDYIVTGAGIEPCDEEVVLDPYHMCLLYQVHEEVGHNFEFD